MKRLRDIIPASLIREWQGPEDVDVRNIQFDSRKAGPGDLFIAIPGTKSDGHQFISQCVEAGASAVVCEKIPSTRDPHVAFVRVENSNHALGLIASAYFGEPSRELSLVGVTGTNGKTTIATLLYRLFSALGYGAGLISTIRYIILGQELPSSHTTPDAIQIQSLLRELADRGGAFCFMEVSSHAIDQDRIAGLHFSGAIFTNLTHDHLDYHKTFSAYLNAKKRFFDTLAPEAFALVNADDRNGLVMTQNTVAQIRTYALRKPADFKGRLLDNQLEGLHLRFNDQEFICRLTGTFNAYNLLAVYGAAVLLGEEPGEVIRLLSSLGPVEGRFETLRSADNITAIVDYAHTPDALKNVLETIRDIRTRNEKLITVVGAGGDRDKSKRPEMARICAEMSDVVILTSDNPRSEDPEDIIRDMRSGVAAEHARKVTSIVSRKDAIQAAYQMARSGDIILVAGKGHETYQEIKGVRQHFDDREILSDLMKPTKPSQPN